MSFDFLLFFFTFCLLLYKRKILLYMYVDAYICVVYMYYNYIT